MLKKTRLWYMATQGLEIGTWGVYTVKQRNSSSAASPEGRDVPSADTKRGICKPAAAESSWFGFSHHHTRREAQGNLTFLLALGFYGCNRFTACSLRTNTQTNTAHSRLHLFKQLFQENEGTNEPEVGVLRPRWTNGKIQLVRFSSVMLMVQLNWLLWRKITVNNLNFLLIFFPRYLTFLDKIFS